MTRLREKKIGQEILTRPIPKNAASILPKLVPKTPNTYAVQDAANHRDPATISQNSYA